MAGGSWQVGDTAEPSDSSTAGLQPPVSAVATAAGPSATIDTPPAVSGMLYHVAATAAAVLHFTFIVFVVGGGFIALRWRNFAWIHLPAAAWGAIIEVMHWSCPLTGLENALLHKAGRAGYDEGFVAHYLFALVYPARLTRGMEITIAIFVIVVNVLVYRRVFR